jgi:transposase
MRKDALKEFVSLRQSLTTERETLQKRLREIEAALGGGEIPLSRRAASGRAEGLKRRQLPKRIANPMSLRAAIVKVTSESPKTKAEILKSVKKLGYRFSGKDPMNSIGVVLYGKPKFKNENGKFSPGK